VHLIVRAFVDRGEIFIFEKKIFLKKILLKDKIFSKKIFLFLKREILRVEPGRAFTHVHRG